MNDNKHCAETIIKEWRDYEGNIVKARKPYKDAIKKEKMRTLKLNTPPGYGIR